MSNTAQPPETAYRAKYDFEAENNNELSMRKGELVVIVSKEQNGEDNGMPPLWLSVKNGN
jgi:hypothetical protein